MRALLAVFLFTISGLEQAKTQEIKPSPSHRFDEKPAASDQQRGDFVQEIFRAGAPEESTEQNLSSNLPKQAWVGRYNGQANSNDVSYAIALDDSGYVYAAGYSINKHNNFDYITIKYDHTGKKKWAGRYNGPTDSTDVAQTVAVDKAGNVYVGGYSIGAHFKDGVTIKYDKTGAVQWIARYNGEGNWHDGIFDLEIDAAGNVYVTGYSYDIANGYDLIIIKYDQAGMQQWIARYDGPAHYEDTGYEMAIDNSGNIYVAGFSTGPTGNKDFLTVKYNSAGIQQWEARYNSVADSTDIAYDIALDHAGNIYVAGASYGDTGNSDYATIKYSPDGAQQWVSQYNGQGNRDDRPYDLAVDASGNVYVTGRGFEGTATEDYATVKYNSAGIKQWVARYNGAGDGKDTAHRLIADADGNVYVTGYSDGGVGPNFDYVTIKYNSAGAKQWSKRFNAAGDSADVAYDMVLDAAGNVHVTGSSLGNLSSNLDGATIKYEPPQTSLAVAEEEAADQADAGALPATYDLAQNFPNPFWSGATSPAFSGGNPSTTIRFALPEAGKVKLTLYNLRGEEVRVLMEGEMAAGYHDFNFAAGDLASGVYFYRLQAGAFNMTKKMILQK